MRQLNENEVKSIEAQVRKKGLNTRKVLSEIVDHVSCAVERKLDEGLDFSQALEEVIAGFGENGIRNIQ